MTRSMSLLLLAIVAGALIGATRWVTAERIAANEEAREARLVQTLLGDLPDAVQRNALCRRGVRGYAGTIDLIIADKNTPATPLATAGQAILAVRVIRHSETPGIGDFIEIDRSDWIRGFSGRQRVAATTNTVAAWSRELDAVVGATVTRNALIRAVAEGCTQ